MSAVEGRVPFRGYETWYRVVGDGEDDGKLPVICLHGGPGATHWYLEPLEGIASSGRRAVFYDQLGCGASSQPHDPSMWTVELFVDEVNAVREALELERLHLFGNSWGGMLAMEVALTPSGLARVARARVLAGVDSAMGRGDRAAARATAGRRPGDAEAPRGGRHHRLARVRGGVRWSSTAATSAAPTRGPSASTGRSPSFRTRCTRR